MNIVRKIVFLSVAAVVSSIAQAADFHSVGDIWRVTAFNVFDGSEAKLTGTGFDEVYKEIPETNSKVLLYLYHYHISGDVVVPSQIDIVTNLTTKATARVTITELNADAFRNYNGQIIDTRLKLPITSIVIPSTVQTIGRYQFYHCYSLKSVTFPESVSSIETTAMFGGCSSLESLVLPAGTKEIKGDMCLDCVSLKSVRLPTGITSIGNNAFKNCSSLAAIDLPNGINNIGTEAFADCSALESIKLPDTITKLLASGFKNCTKLKTVDFGSGSYSLPNYFFEGCTGLESVSIPGSVTSFGNDVFKGCVNVRSLSYCSSAKVSSLFPDAYTSITNIILTSGVTSLGASQFNGCESLVELTLPEGLERINNGTFTGCRSLSEITLPSTVNYFGSLPFQDCPALKKIVFRGDVPKLYSKTNVFKNLHPDCVLYVPETGSWTSALDENNKWSGLPVVFYHDGVIESWEDVDNLTAFDAIPALKEDDAALLARAGVKPKVLAEWAENIGKVRFGDEKGINLNAFLMNAANDATSFEIDEELLSAVFDANPNHSIFKTRFPNAKVSILEVNEGALHCDDNAKFYRLKLELPQ